MSSAKWHLSCLSLNVLIQFCYKSTNYVVIDVVIVWVAKNIQLLMIMNVSFPTNNLQMASTYCLNQWWLIIIEVLLRYLSFI